MALSSSTDRFNGVLSTLAIKAPCAAVAIANITLSGEQTVNGVAVVAGDRVLVTAQTSAIDNGIYDASSSAWSRSPDFDGNRDVVSGTFVTVATATVGRNPYYQITTANPITIGNTAINFTLADGPNVSFELTAGEIAEGLTDNDIDDSIEPGHVLRYVTNTVPGTTDCTAGILTAAASVGAGGTVTFPSEKCFTSTGISDTAGEVHFEGVGSASEIVGAGGIDIVTFDFQASTLKKLKITVNSYNAATVLVRLNNGVSGAELKACVLKGFFQNPLVGIGILVNGAESSNFIGNTVQSCAVAISLETATIAPNANLFSANLINLNTVGVYYENGSNANGTWIGNTIQGNEIGMRIGTGINYHITLLGNHFENNIGATPTDLLLECGGASAVNSFGNNYNSFSDTDLSIPWGIDIVAGSQPVLTLDADNVTRIRNDGDTTFSRVYIRNLKRRDIVYSAPNAPPLTWRVSAPVVPPAGIWQKGSHIDNSDPAVGQPSGWVCTTRGSLVSVTATGTPTTDGATGIITGVTNATSFLIGSSVTVSAGFATTGPFIIIRKFGTTLIVDAISNSVQVGVAVAQGASVFPVFSPLANL